MTPLSPDDELKYTRRLFLQHTALATTAATYYSIAMKTDAIAQEIQKVRGPGDAGDGMPYPYHMPPT